MLDFGARVYFRWAIWGNQGGCATTHIAPSYVAESRRCPRLPTYHVAPELRPASHSQLPFINSTLHQCPLGQICTIRFLKTDCGIFAPAEISAESSGEIKGVALPRILRPVTLRSLGDALFCQHAMLPPSCDPLPIRSPPLLIRHCISVRWAKLALFGF